MFPTVSISLEGHFGWFLTGGPCDGLFAEALPARNEKMTCTDAKAKTTAKSTEGLHQARCSVVFLFF
jgi:hypothetical protein